ncbi:unnamed protein product, partial [Laminaria digitata]
MDNDDALAALLTALEDLHNIQNEMHTCIKKAREGSSYHRNYSQLRGFLNMAKARRSMGRNSVSVLDTREEFSAEVTISMSDCDSDGQLQQSVSTFSRNRTEPVDSPAGSRGGSLRQRGGVVAPEIEESLLQPGQDAPLRGDSLNLFATLVPPPLRKSKKDFTSVVDYAVEASNLAHRILLLRNMLEA